MQVTHAYIQIEKRRTIPTKMTCEKYPGVTLRMPTVFRAERAKGVGKGIKKLALSKRVMAVAIKFGIMV